MLKFAIKKTSKDIFHDAIANKDIARLKFLLQNNRLRFQVDELDDDGLTALQRSCFIGNLKLVQLLVTHGANFHIQDREGWSVLHASAVAGNYSILRYLVCVGADVTVRNDLGQLPIDLATDLYCIIILVEAMLKAGRSDLTDKYFSQRPSLKALIEDKLRRFAPETPTTSLIDTSFTSARRHTENENSNKHDKGNQLSYSLNGVNSEQDLSETTQSIESLGDLLSTFKNKEHTVRLNDEGGIPEEGRLLLNKRTPKRAVCNKCLGKKRHSSASSSSSESSTSSCDSAYISSVSLHSGDSLSSSQLRIESSNDESAFYCDLLKQTLNSTKQKSHNCRKKERHYKLRSHSSPASFIPKRNRLLDKIKEHDNVNALDSSGLSLLHVTASQGDTESVQMLLDKGAEVNRQALNGSSPLHEASRSGNLDCALLLLSYGADIFADDDNGLLPIDMANDNQVKLLLHRAMVIK